MACQKRGYANAHQARLAHRQAGYRLRVYRCGDCGNLHTTNADKTRLLEPLVSRGGPVRRKMELAPERTLDELERLAAEKRKAAGY